ncbi:MAG: adenylate kinase [Treponema sp.]|nr:adenylate kinase [Treponema sp.]
MNFIFLGPPGAGKGSLAVKVATAYGIPHISTGDIFRAAIKNQTELGKKVKAIIDSGALVSDDITCALVKERLAADDVRNGFILDGFPRTIPQAETLATFCPDVTVINFLIQDAIVVERLSTRRVCRSCGANYNIISLPPKTDDVCDTCGGELYQRDDDTVDAVAHRMEVYREQTEPLIEYYSKKGTLIDIDAALSTDRVFAVFQEQFPNG